MALKIGRCIIITIGCDHLHAPADLLVHEGCLLPHCKDTIQKVSVMVIKKNKKNMLHTNEKEVGRLGFLLMVA